MATYDRRVIRTTRVEYTVPADPPYGASWAEVAKAITAAKVERSQAGQLTDDDQIHVSPGDDAVIVWHETDREVSWDTPARST